MKNGDYVLVIAPDEYPGKKYRGRYCYEHHLVWWRNTGQVVNPGYVVHHKDGNKHNNIFSNLELLSLSNHMRLHNRVVARKIKLCLNCQQPFVVRRPGAKTRFCSRRCIGLYGYPKRCRVV